MCDVCVVNHLRRIAGKFQQRSCGLMDKSPDFWSGDCRMKSCHDQSFCFIYEMIVIMTRHAIAAQVSGNVWFYYPNTHWPSWAVQHIILGSYQCSTVIDHLKYNLNSASYLTPGQFHAFGASGLDFYHFLYWSKFSCQSIEMQKVLLQIKNSTNKYI